MKRQLCKLYRSILKYIFPERIKRLIFMSSVISKLTDSKQLDAETLKRLNETLHICEFQNAMLLPMRYSHTLWNDEVVHRANDDGTPDLDQQKAAILNQVPQWLIYNHKDMETDLVNILMYCPTFQISTKNEL